MQYQENVSYCGQEAACFQQTSCDSGEVACNFLKSTQCRPYLVIYIIYHTQYDSMRHLLY